MTTGIPNLSVQTEPTMGYGDYLRFRALVQERSGLYFPEKRRAELERGIRRAFAASTCTDLDEYYHILHDLRNGSVHMEQLVNALTVGETHFFRDAAQFDMLYRHVLPQIIARRRPLQTLRIWSAGCASGEEPYSIAMLLRELLPDLDEWAITILGSDVNTEVLGRARKAIYSDWAFREDRAKEWRPRYFRRHANRYELTLDVRRMVTFTQLNLAEGKYPDYETNTTLMDLILCRNVMMYFTEATTRRIVERFYEALTDGGWLVVGHAEHSLVTYRRFQIHNFPNAILYQRAEDSLFAPADLQWVIEPTQEPTSPLPTASREPAADLPVSLRPKPDVTKIETPPSLPPADEEVPQPLQDPVGRASELLDYGRSEEAFDLLSGLLEQNQGDATIYTLLGKACANLGHWEEAEGWCRKAIALDKLALEAYYLLALVLQHQEQVESAIEAMKKVVYIDRHHVLGHFGLANLYRNNGRTPQALKSLDNARRLLDDYGDDDVIPTSSGITAGRLKGAVIRQQQRWSADNPGL